MALEEAVGRKAIFLMGSACAKAFLDGGIMEWSGLELRPKLLSAPVVMCGPNPALVFQSSESYTPPWGEVTWSIQRFAEILERDGIL